MRARALITLTLALTLAACAGMVGSSPTPAVALSTAELKYRVMDLGGRPEFCDPDFYPVARVDEREAAAERIGEIRQDAETYAAITKRVGVDELEVYREWKVLRALPLSPASFGAPTVPQTMGFAYRAAAKTTPPARDAYGTQVEGTVDFFGNVTITKRTDAGPLACPICLARGTRIATPNGEVAVELLRRGDIVWTVDSSGARVAARLVAVGSTAVRDAHMIVRLALADGRTVDVSPGHPTADGRLVSALRSGEHLDGATIVGIQRVRYDGGATFDVLPVGATGVYWANGVLLKTSLR